MPCCLMGEPVSTNRASQIRPEQHLVVPSNRMLNTAVSEAVRFLPCGHPYKKCIDGSQQVAALLLPTYHTLADIPTDSIIRKVPPDID